MCQHQVNKLNSMIFKNNNSLTGGIMTEQLHTVLAISGGVIGVFLLTSIGVAFCLCKRRKARKVAENVTDIDIDVNPTYGDYYDPDPVVEVEDINDYYTGVYQDGSTMTRDNNSQYEN